MESKRVAVVTGAASGIGRATSGRLAADGFRVWMVDRNGEALQREAEALADAGQDVIAHALDLTDEAASRAWMATLPRLDVLINNAGVFYERDFHSVRSEDFRHMFDVNLLIAATLTQEAARHMHDGGRIVNIASRACLGARNYPHYVASKAALVGYTRATALELAPLGILVNAIAPGLIDTPMTQALSHARLQQQMAAQPAGVMGRPSDIAQAVAFFASPDTRFITGQILFVDGGKSLGGLSA